MTKNKKLVKIIAFIIFLALSNELSKVSALSPIFQRDGRIIYVKEGAIGDCSSWENACRLQTALYIAEVDDEVWVAAGVYKPTTSSNREATFHLKSKVEIYGGFPASGGEWSEREWETHVTLLSGDIGIIGNYDDNSYHIVDGSGVDNTAILDGFTISGGNANGNSPNNNGGGIYSIGGNLLLRNVIIENNTASSMGGGMFNYSESNPTLENVKVRNNFAEGGGGMYNGDSSSPNLSSVQFSNNSASNGGECITKIKVAQ